MSTLLQWRICLPFGLAKSHTMAGSSSAPAGISLSLHSWRCSPLLAWMVEGGIRVQHPWPQPIRGGGGAWDEIRASQKRTGLNTASCSHTTKSFYESSLTNKFMSLPSSVHLRLTYIYAITPLYSFAHVDHLWAGDWEGIQKCPLMGETVILFKYIYFNISHVQALVCAFCTKDLHVVWLHWILANKHLHCSCIWK